MSGLRVGLLGGSFNPAHEGHRHISLVALERLALDQVWWMVSPQNPLKPVSGMADFTHRVQQARDIARHPRIVVTDVENRLGTRFTAETVKRLQQRHPSMRFVWLMGADNLLQIPEWRNWRTIFNALPIAILDRGPYSIFYRALSGQAAQTFKPFRVSASRASRLADMDAPAWVYLRDMKRHPASATGIREAARSRQSSGPPDINHAGTSS